MQKAMHADRHNGCQRAEYCSGQFEDSDPTRGVLPAPKVALANLTRDDPYPFVAYLVISWVYIRGRWILSSAWWRVEKVGRPKVYAGCPERPTLLLRCSYAASRFGSTPIRTSQIISDERHLMAGLCSWPLIPATYLD